jgi:LysR family transcriptional regulator for metE and metH
MILETRHLRLVAAVADHGTLTAAGRVLHLTQSALSHQLIALERALGGALFHRVGKRMVPTAAGRRLTGAARESLERLRAAEADVRQLAAGAAGVLRLSTECQTSYHWLPRVLAPFRRAFPGVEVEVVAGATRQPAEALLDGRLDLAVVLSTGAHPDRLEYVPLFRDQLVALLPAAHPLAVEAAIDVAALAGEHLIVYGGAEVTRGTAARAVRQAGVRFRRVSRLHLTEAIVELVRAGTGVSILADWSIAPYVHAAVDGAPVEGALRAVPIRGPAFQCEWHAAMLAGERPPYVAGFAALLATHAPGRAAAS